MMQKYRQMHSEGVASPHIIVYIYMHMCVCVWGVCKGKQFGHVLKAEARCATPDFFSYRHDCRELGFGLALYTL